MGRDGGGRVLRHYGHGRSRRVITGIVNEENHSDEMWRVSAKFTARRAGVRRMFVFLDGLPGRQGGQRLVSENLRVWEGDRVAPSGSTNSSFRDSTARPPLRPSRVHRMTGMPSYVIASASDHARCRVVAWCHCAQPPLSDRRPHTPEGLRFRFKKYRWAGFNERIVQSQPLVFGRLSSPEATPT